MSQQTREHWSVEVSRNGENIVTLESNCISGKADFSPEDEHAIERAALCLLSFLGKPAQPSGATAPQETITAVEAMREICALVRCEPDEVLETVQRLMWAASALPAPSPAPSGEWWGVIGPRGMPCLYGKHREDAEPDTDERVALFQVTEVTAVQETKEKS